MEKNKQEVFKHPIVWSPTEEQIRTSQIERFRQTAGLPSFEALSEKAATDPAWFWGEILRDLDIAFKVAPEAVHRESEDPTRPQWCVGGQLNIVESCVDKWVQQGEGHRTALVHESESGVCTTKSYLELLHDVVRASGALKAGGVKKGDVVALMMPMNADLVVAFLAIARCGAIILPLFTGYGKTAIETRLLESGAKHAVVSRSSSRRGKIIEMAAPFIEAAVACPRLDNLWISGELTPPPPTGLKVRSWEISCRQAGDSTLPEAETMAADDPVLLIFTSGTTGKPKGALHSHCGFPIKAAQDMKHPMNLDSSDTLYWMTDIGWMMGPWAIFGSLLGGMKLALYDGAPDFPAIGRLWELIKKHRITFLGISPTLARIFQNHPSAEPEASQVASLKAVGSTGSPWDTESWMWVFEKVLKGSKPIINYSGGTEISGGILCGNFLTPLKPCAFSGPVLGMNADILNEQGEPVREETGELVIRNPWIGMTRGFWKNDPRYHSTYWEKFPGIWTHGDRCFVDKDGLWYIVGRSDDTLKIAGKRLGPAEVESIVNSHQEILDSAAIGVFDALKGEALVVYAVPKNPTGPGRAAEDLKKNLTSLIAAELGKPLAPKEVRLVKSLPKTRNAKIIHRMIRSSYEGQPLGDQSSIESTQAIEDLEAYI